MKIEDYPYPVYATQGGGVVRYVNGAYVFVEAPPAGMGLIVGDLMPAEWGIVPVNTLAKVEIEQFRNRTVR